MGSRHQRMTTHLGVSERVQHLWCLCVGVDDDGRCSESPIEPRRKHQRHVDDQEEEDRDDDQEGGQFVIPAMILMTSNTMMKK